MTGTHVGCEHGVCGACTIDMDGDASPRLPDTGGAGRGATIRTVEGLAPGSGRLSVLQDAFRRHHALQCGFCTAGILMSLDIYLRHHADPSEHDLREYLSAAICVAAPAICRSSRRRSTPRLRLREAACPMLDLGNSFLSSVERDPRRACYRRRLRAADLRAMVSPHLGRRRRIRRARPEAGRSSGNAAAKPLGSGDLALGLSIRRHRHRRRSIGARRPTRSIIASKIPKRRRSFSRAFRRIAVAPFARGHVAQAHCG